MKKEKIETKTKQGAALQTEEKMSRYGPYTEEVIKHFRNPQNLGEIEGADAVAKVGSPICGDELWLYIKVDKNEKGEPYIKDIKFQSFGCAAAVATGSMITELAKGKTLKDALNIKRQDVSVALGGLPVVKIHCSLLSTDALHEAIYNYYKAHNIQIPPELEQLHQNIQKGTTIARIKQEAAEDYCLTPGAKKSKTKKVN
jgi:nitrogen fixation NifU-like protein